MIRAPNNQARTGLARLKALLLWLVIATAVLYGLTLIAWKMGVDPGGLFGWSERAYAVIEPVRWLIAAGRIALMFALWWFWPALVKRWFPETLSGYARQREVWMALRHKVFFMFLFLEACIHVSYLGRVG